MDVKGSPAAAAQPVLLLSLPALDRLARNGIVRAKRDEDHRSRLRPMRATEFADAQFAFRIETLAEHRKAP